MNPLCKCGCGWEVALPWNKYIQAHHNTIRLTSEKRAAIEQMMDDRVSTYKIAEFVGVSQAQIVNWRFTGLPKDRKPAERIIRWEDLQRLEEDNCKEFKYRKEVQEWRKAKRTLKQIRHLLRDPQKLHEAASKQGQTSQT